MVLWSPTYRWRRGRQLASRLAISTLVNLVLQVPDWILRVDDARAQETMGSGRLGTTARSMPKSPAGPARIGCCRAWELR